MSAPVTPPASSKATIPLIIAAVVGVVGLLSCGLCGGLVFLGTQKAREAAKRIECTNNLKILGIALHTYHDNQAALPTEAGSAPSLYVPLLPYLEMQHVAQGLQQGDGGAASTPVKEFLCPSRRPIGSTPGGKRDYGYAASQGAEKSILDTPAPLPLNAVANANGAGNTLLLAHVWIDPRNYQGGDPTDLGWATKNNARSVNNTAKQDNDPAGSTNHIGGPHPNVIPCLFADGHVQNMPYHFAHWVQAWSWTNTQPFPLP